MGLNIPVNEVKKTILLLMDVWVGPGWVVVDVFSPAMERFKVAIWMANKGDFALVSVEAVAEYMGHKGVEVDLWRASISIVVPSTWLLLLEDGESAWELCVLCKIMVLGKELDVSLWKESFRQVEHWVYISGLAETTSRRSVVEFLNNCCGTTVDHFFGKLNDNCLALWMTVQFKSAGGMNKALSMDGTVYSGPLQCPLMVVSEHSQAPITQEKRSSTARSLASPSQGWRRNGRPNTTVRPAVSAEE